MRRILMTAAVACVAFAPGAWGQAEQTAADFRRIVQEAKDKVFPAVVYIKCVRETMEGGKKQSQEVSGSGVIISSDGVIVSNWHVIDKAVQVRCLLTDGSHYDADVLGSDQDTDLAILRLRPREGGELQGLPYAHFGDSSLLQEGDFVMAMGAPWGLNRSVSIGIISCTTRYLEGVSEYSLWLQTDAAINPGNSGGPLVNTDGQIIGINARGMAAWAADNMGFAIPAETALKLLDPMRENGRVGWTWTGLQLQPLRDFNRNMFFEGDKGVIVAETDPESPARRAGIEHKDRILRINGVELNALTSEHLPAVRRTLAFLPADEPAVFEVQRGGELLTFELTPREKGDVEGGELDCPRWDLTVKEINQFDNPDLYFHRTEGVFIYGVRRPGNAANAGLSRNDIILSIDGKPVTTLEDVKAIHAETIENVDARSRIVFQVLRRGLMRQVVLDFSRDYERR